MPYPELMIRPMREDLTRNGIEEARTPEQVEDAINNTDGTVMLVVNSVCGCAAGKARPGIVMALQNNEIKPDRAITVFAGADIEATERARELMAGQPPSSPSVALFKNGELVYLMPRHQIETSYADEIAANLASAFNQHCVKDSAAQTA